MRPPRFTISGLMTTVLVASLGLTALHSANETWAGVMLLVTHGILALAVVGAICRRGAGRAWWLGFLAFGWSYLHLSSSWAAYQLPTITLLEVIQSNIGAPASPASTSRTAFGLQQAQSPFAQVGHCLWSLLAATLGAFLARTLFATGVAQPEGGVEGTQVAGPVKAGGWRRLAAITLVGFVLIATIAAVGSRSTPGLWSGSIFFLTCGVLGLMALGAAFGRGRRRATWSGAALFGVTYMLLIFGSEIYERSSPHSIGDSLVHDLREWLPSLASESLADRAGVIAANERVLNALDQVIPMRFPHETPLEDVLKYIHATALCPDGRGIPIFVDPVGLKEVEKSRTSPVQIELEGVPLSTTLRLTLRPLGMTYYVKDGLLEITSMGCYDRPYELEDAYLVVGHCLLALVAAMLGGLLAPLIAEPRSTPAADAGGTRVPAVSGESRS
jgi:hypothetical protein